MYLIKILLIFYNVKLITSIDPLVLTSQGLIKGIINENSNYAMFLGIPYGVVDENDPFGDARPHPGFNATYEAINDGTECLQYMGAAKGTIHCLNLNIFVPHTSNSFNTLPVMVYIHGGAFIIGSGNSNVADASFLMKHDVIVVTMNYRLGLYGYLCVDDSEYNNQALKDQIIALKWINDNIHAFGGDVNSITLFGQSAGAMNIDLLLLCVEDKLFHRVIIQSGTAISPWIVTEKNDTILLSIANRLGYTGINGGKEVIEFLSGRDPIEVISAANDLKLITSGGHPLTKPCNEMDENGTIKDFPMNLKPKVHDLDIMIGYTNKEVMFIYPGNDPEFYKNFQFSDEMTKEFKEVLDEDIVRQFYVGDKELNQELQSEILDFGSDFAFFYPVERTMSRYLLNGANKVYRYVFAYNGERSIGAQMLNFTADGICHGDDLNYLFKMGQTFSEDPSIEDQKMIDIMTAMWTNFAKYGDPTPTMSELIPVTWPTVTLDKQPYMLLDLPLAVHSRPFNQRMAFWDLYYKLYQNKLRGYKEN